MPKPDFNYPPDQRVAFLLHKRAQDAASALREWHEWQKHPMKLARLMALAQSPGQTVEELMDVVRRHWNEVV